jgi:hypothetical protein
MRRLKPLKRIPRFHSREEEREFWDTHDTTEYFDEESLVRLAPHIKNIELIHVYLAPNGTRYIMIPEEMRKAKTQISNSRKTAFLTTN